MPINFRKIKFKADIEDVKRAGLSFGGILKETQKEANEYKKKQYKLVKKLANLFKLELIQTIQKQDLELAPLTDSYLQSKKNKGLDERILIATGEYIKSIKVRPYKGGKNIRKVSIAPEGQHKNTNLTNLEIAFMLENGTKNMPARPHWKVVARRFTEDTMLNKNIEAVSRGL